MIGSLPVSRPSFNLRAFTSVVAAAVLLVGVAVEACEIAPGITPRGRMDWPGVVVVFVTQPAPIEVGRHFAVDVRVCSEDTPATLVRVDAHMRAHRHGMNYRPTLTAKGDGRWLAEGLLFHMPGTWSLTFDLTHGKRNMRLDTEIVLE